MKDLPLKTINFIDIHDCFLRTKFWRQSGDMELKEMEKLCYQHLRFDLCFEILDPLGIR